MSASTASQSLFPTLSQRLEWLGLRFLVPQDWEVVRHGLSADRGSLVLVDRRQQRMTLSWTQCRAEPNVERLLSDYKGKQREQSGAIEFETLRLGRYRGFRHTAAGGERISRAVYYEKKHARLVELLFIDRERANGDAELLQLQAQSQSQAQLQLQSPLQAQVPRERQLLRRLLDTLVLAEAANDCRRWCAFGLFVVAPPRFKLRKTDVKPADVSFEFVELDPRGDETQVLATVRRRGLAAAWFDGDLQKLVQGHWKKASWVNVAARSVVSADGSECEGIDCVGIEPGPPLHRWLGRLRELCVSAWHNPADNAVYEVACLSPRKRKLSPAAFEVRGADERGRSKSADPSEERD